MACMNVYQLDDIHIRKVGTSYIVVKGIVWSHRAANCGGSRSRARTRQYVKDIPIAMLKHRACDIQFQNHTNQNKHALNQTH